MFYSTIQWLRSPNSVQDEDYINVPYGIANMTAKETAEMQKKKTC